MPFTPYPNLPPTTRVWIYQSNRPFEADEVATINTQIQQFVEQWTSHQQALQAWGDVQHNRFIILAVDESQADASGCSIDKSVAFIRKIEQAFGVDLFDRWNFAYQQGDSVQAADRDTFAQLYQTGEINDTTLVFNNLVNTKADLETKWRVQLGDSWHKNFV